MSTHWGFVCQSHDPELTSEWWFNHGETLLAKVYAEERRGQWPDDPEYGPGGRWDALGPSPLPVVNANHPLGTIAPIEWLRLHPRCKVALRNEYGETRDLPMVP